MRSLGKYLVEILEANGVDFVFGIPGVHTVDLYRGLEKSSIRHVTPRHEQGAGFMADGYARVTGKPGVCFIITGPGMTNIATAMGQAYGDSIPMLVISSVNSPGEIGSGRGHLHELKDQRALIRGVSAFSHTILDVREIEPVLARAFALFSAGRPRPVHIEIPVALLNADASAMPPAGRFSLPPPPGPPADAVKEIATRLAGARRPLIVAGGGALRAAGAIRSLAERLGAPVLMTVNARGVFPGDHPLAVPLTGESDPVIEFLKGADATLALGTEFGPTDFADALPATARLPGWLARADLDAEQLMRGLLADLPLLADARLTAEAVLAAMPAGEPGGVGARTAQAARQEVEAAMNPVLSAGLRMLDMLAETFPDAIVAGDSTQPVYAGCTAFGAPQPGGFFCSATGFGTLGYALPAAIGAALGAPDRPVFGLIGDGGLQFTIGEMASATEAGTCVRLILWNNAGYSEIKKYMTDAGVAPLGVDIHTPNFEPIAKGFGWRYSKVANMSEFAAALASPGKGNEVIEIDETSFVASLAGGDA
ncbi:5-guanidino-2-oxopentanoate decarboxylase [Pseudaminobacter sp. 19-2017]|uniref:5-guanidino-2-oxopentanoate decarboxylase n=1 Tax=Pseudaminobacter soli (ex Zhang et al. 2022) TaxID=2831468 RepID=A0A942E372_9HYPH|nr:5-guanidino-2-oxopentanoate decarboxylase [Pseudaminobacter soli]MBS3652132.1 5-guanidino-2-oxopentanoate decarboxylase [Pseudaminobacter soli]